MILASVPGMAAKTKAKPKESKMPVMLVLGSAAAGNSGVSDPLAFSTVVDKLKASGLLDVMLFNRDLPSVQEAVKDGRIASDMLEKPAEDKAGLQIGKGMGADYVLRIKAGTEPDYDVMGKEKNLAGMKMQIDADLYDLNTGKKSTCQAGSRIMEAPMLRQEAARDAASYTAGDDVAVQVIQLIFGATAVLNMRRAEQQSAAAAQSSGAVRDIASEYKQAIGAANEYGAKKDIPNQIVALRSAINLRPGEIEPRLTLASLYAVLGMNREATDEYNGVLLFNPGNTVALNKLSSLYASSGDAAGALADYEDMARMNPNDPKIRISLGDLYWNLGRIDDAEKAYLKAVSLDSSNSTSHERLAKLYGAKKKYDESLDQLFRSKIAQLDKNPDANAQYDCVSAIAQTEINSIVDRISSSEEQFVKGVLPREGYYQECKDDQAILDAVDRFISARATPAAVKSAHSHLVLSLALLSQANASELAYLETEKQHYSGEAGTLRAESKAEMAKYAKALGNT